MLQNPVRPSANWLCWQLVRWRLVLFLAGGILLVVAYRYLSSHPVYYNRSMESFFPEHDRHLQFYRKSREWFASEHTLLVVYRDPQLWTAEGMDRQLRLAHRLETCPGVHRVVALANSPAPTNPMLTIGEAVKRSRHDGDVTKLREKVEKTRLYAGVTLGPDAITTALVVQLHRELGKPEEAGQKLETIRRTAQEFMQSENIPQLEGPYTAGTLLMIHDVYEYTAQDGRRLQFFSVLLMAIVITGAFVVPELRQAWIRYRLGQVSLLRGMGDVLASTRWLILPFLVIYSTLTWSEAIWSLVRGEITMVGSAISSLVAVISVTSVVHLGLHYKELRQRMDSQLALQQTLRYLGPALFWVILTTAGGFAALLVCQIKPVYDFGMIMALATGLVGVATLFFFPLTAMGWQSQPAYTVQTPSWMQNSLNRLLLVLDSRPWMCGCGLLLPMATLALGMTRLQPQTDFTNNFRSETGVYQSYRFIEDYYGGAGQLELILSTPDLFSLSNEELSSYLRRLQMLQDRLTNIEITLESGETVKGITKAISIPDFYDFMDNIPVVASWLTPRARLFMLAGDLPNAKKELGVRAALVPAGVWQKIQENAVLFSFWNREERKLRILLQARERLSAWAKRKLLAQIDACCQETLGAQAEYQLTGVYLMLAGLIESVLRDQAYTTLVSLACMFLMAVLAFQRWKLALIALVPTVLPVLAVVGTMGWIGLPVNIATAMLASVAMGMTIDSSLLYLYRLREEQLAGQSFAVALIRTHRSTGAALLVASFALVLGFSVLTQSRFIPLVHFGLLSALALLGGVIGNLVLLPLLLRLTHRSDWRELVSLHAQMPLENGADVGSPVLPSQRTGESASV